LAEAADEVLHETAWANDDIDGPASIAQAGVPEMLQRLEERVESATVVPAAAQHIDQRADARRVDGPHCTAGPRGEPAAAGVWADEVIVVGRHDDAQGPGLLVALQLQEDAGREEVVEVVQVDDIGMEMLQPIGEGFAGNGVVEITARAAADIGQVGGREE